MKAVDVRAIGVVGPRGAAAGRWFGGWLDVERRGERASELPVADDLDLAADVRERPAPLDRDRVRRRHGCTMDVPGGGTNANSAGGTGSLTRGFEKSNRLRLPWPSMIITRRTWEVAAST